ncbi:hypothetical protein OG402_36195 [Streptomyces anulatus]|uniref:hypothetical protein n=1 Tax=Streptomyces anulatus TaxID=1892 RepID=UPI00225715BA|nr:hypothetical protein [Streptomyces anulatus]MCX4522892.1 hypothetical protein [Streptomyces anulatus]MCX4605903.1 hypothetical protein [Streptomyces anulatus]WSU77839.1 hypothetical protein OG499_34960 [Streptomyces anulatus]
MRPEFRGCGADQGRKGSWSAGGAGGGPGEMSGGAALRPEGTDHFEVRPEGIDHFEVRTADGRRLVTVER